MSFFRSSTAALPVVSTPTHAVKPQFSGLQVQTSSSALPIPIVYGRTRIAPNLVWSGDFQSHPHFSRPAQTQTVVGTGGKGGSAPTIQTTQSPRQITGYTYTTAFAMGLCEGPITNLLSAYSGQSVTSASAINTSLIAGTTPQTPWSFLTTNHAGQALAYQGTALVVSSRYNLGSSASLGTLSFEVAGLLYQSGSSSGDADPAATIFDYLTSPQYGVGFASASIDASLYSTYQVYCQAHGLAFSPALSDQEAANATLTRWLQLTNSTAVWSGGRLKILPYDDGAAALYDLGDDDFIADTQSDPVIVTRIDPASAANIVSLEALDRSNMYSPSTVTARDQSSIEQTGARPAAVVTAHEVCDLGVAANVAQLILQRGLYIRNTYAFKLSWEHCLLEPMDVVTLTDAGLGLAQTPVRIIEIAEDGEGLLSVTAEEYPAAVATSAGFNVDAAAGAVINRIAAPASVNPPVLIEPPSDLTNGTPQLWVGLSGGAAGIADPNWGGAAIFASTDNATYDQVGATTGPANQGMLTAALSAPPGAPTDVLAVSFVESGATIIATSQPTLVAVDGEIMSFTSATLTGTSTYNLGGLKRAIYGGRGGAHSIGAQALVLDTAVFAYTLPATAIGKPLWFKFASVNTFGQAIQDLSTCTAYQTVPVGSGLFGPIAQAIATGTSFDEGLSSTAVNETDDFGLASDVYKRTVDEGLASEAATALAVQSGGTGATSPTMARQNIGAATSGVNTDITALSGLTTPIAISAGGTAATTAAAARGNLAAAASGANADIYQLSALTTAILVNQGGTGSTTAAGARANLGAAAAGANSDITALSGLTTPLALARGGTGATSASGARSALGAASSGGNVDISSLTNLAGLAIGTSVDTTTNLFTLKSASALFDNAGAGIAIGVNKAASASSAYHQFATGYSARAQVGLLGSDRWRVSVSSSGSSFSQAIDVDPATGHIGLSGYTADANNALGVLGTACLFAAATDSMRFTFSKVSAANDATLSFQTNYSARALLGTAGSDAFQLKVSPDGTSFYQVIVCDQTNGNAAFKALLGLAGYAVAALPAGLNGAIAFATNGRKASEASGAGTGVVVAFSNGQWRRLSDDAVVSA